MKVALLPWGNVIEDYLDTINVTIDGFATEMEGGWLFGYAEALRSAGADACLIVVSRNARKTRRIVNPKTGLATLVLPSPAAYAWANRVPLVSRYASPWALPRGALAKALQAEGCTHIIMQEYADPRFDSLVPAAHALDLPVTASFQGGQIEPPNARGKSLRRKSLNGSAGLIIASSDEEQRMRGLYGDGLRIGRIFNPIDPAIWFPEDRAACRAALDVPDTARIAVCHCRIDFRRKGLDVLFNAWRQVMANHAEKDFRLHLIGDGSDRDILQAEIDRNPVPGLRWLDRFTQDRAEMRRELSAADFHVQASRHEGFAVAPMEAMACGLPTVLSQAPGAKDLLRAGEASGGLLVPIGDATALAQAMETLLTDDTRRLAMGNAARTHVLATGAIKAVGRQLVDFLSDTPAL